MKPHRFCPVAVLMTLAGCATDTGVVPTGQDTYMIGSKAMAVGASGHDATADAYRQAAAYCTERGRNVETIKAESRDGGFGRFPNAKLEFRCVGK